MKRRPRAQPYRSTGGRRVHLVAPGAERSLCGHLTAFILVPVESRAGLCGNCRAAEKKYRAGG